MATVDKVIAMTGTLDAEIVVQALHTVAPIAMEGSLASSIAFQNLNNIQIDMQGVLTSEFDLTSCIRCTEFYVNHVPETIYAEGCAVTKKNKPYIRTRGDTLPVPATLGIKGNFDISGFTSIKMSTQIADGTIYTVDATVIDDKKGMVEFPLSLTSVATAGEGTYDIQGDTGTYIHTFKKGIFILEDDLTA